MGTGIIAGGDAPPVLELGQQGLDPSKIRPARLELQGRIDKFLWTGLRRRSARYVVLEADARASENSFLAKVLAACRSTWIRSRRVHGRMSTVGSA